MGAGIAFSMVSKLVMIRGCRLFSTQAVVRSTFPARYGDFFFVDDDTAEEKNSPFVPFNPSSLEKVSSFF